MIALHVHLADKDEQHAAIDKYIGKEIIHTDEPVDLFIVGRGMESGKPSIIMYIPLPDGRVVAAETSFALLNAAMRAGVARFGDPNT